MPPSNLPGDNQYPQQTGYPPQPGQQSQPQLVYGQPQIPQPVQPGQPYGPQPGYGPQAPLPPQPAYPAPQAQAKDSDPYAFFLDAKPKKKSSLPAPGFKLPKILIAAAGLFIILIILAVVLSAARPKQDPSLGLTGVVNTQQEIIRVSTLAETKAEADSLKNLAITANSTTMSSQAELINYITKQGGKINTKALATAKDAQNDRVLDAASAAGTYDRAYHDVMQQLLNDYMVKLQRIHTTTVINSERDIVDKDLGSAELLTKMLSQ